MAAEYCEEAKPIVKGLCNSHPPVHHPTRTPLWVWDESQLSSILEIYPVDHPTSHTEVTTYGDEYVS